MKTSVFLTLKLILLVIFFSPADGQDYDAEWIVPNSSSLTGERLVAVLNTETIGSFSGISLVGKVIDSNSNWGHRLPIEAPFKVFVNFTNNSFNVEQEEKCPNVTLRLRRVNANTFHLTALISTNHIGVRVLIKKVQGSGIFTMGNPLVNNTTGTIVLEEPLYRKNFSGNLGLNTPNPAYDLHVTGDFFLNGNKTHPENGGWAATYLLWKGHSLIMGSRPGTYAHNRLELRPGGSNSGQIHSNLQLYQALSEGNHDLRVNIRTDGVSYFNGGNVGIGTTSPGNYQLAVNGNIRAKEVRVEATGWPDYVFEENYPLMDLGQLESYIKANKHLPEIPSAEEVETNGIELGEMNKLLLMKIEELVLYQIELKKDLKEKDLLIEQILGRLDEVEKALVNKKSN